MYDMYRSVLRSVPCFSNKRLRRKYGRAHGTASVLDSTFMNQFSRKLREIETHSDYGNIEIVVRQGRV